MPSRRRLKNGGPAPDAARTLRRAAAVVRYGLFAAGVTSLLQQVGPFVSDGQFTWGERRVAAIVAASTLGGFALAGWAIGAVFDAAATMLGAIHEGAEAASRAGDLVETQLVPALLRAAAAMEALARDGRGDAATAEVAEVRRAISDGSWRKAERLLNDLADNPVRTALASELIEARRARVDEVAARLDTAMAAEDAEAALALRDELTRHAEGSRLRDLDARVARWLVAWVRVRVKRGDFGADLADLAARGADRFGDVAEGRSLLAAVPDLRRRAGLCPTCARPHRGPAESCPACSGV